MQESYKLSVSKTKTFLDCKKKFKFNYILRFPKKERDYHIFGKFCHQVLEDFHNAYIVHNSKESFNVEMGNAFKNALTKYKSQMTSEMKKECWNIIDQYLKIVSKDKQNNLSANVLACEKPFDFHISENLILNGMIDRVQLDNDNVLHLADYKTTKNKKYLKDDWFQLMTYGFVMLTDNPDLEKIRVSYILLRHDFEYITKEFLAADLLAMKDKYLQYAEQILSEKEFPPNPTILCGYCDFLEHCEEGQRKVSPKTTYGAVDW